MSPTANDVSCEESIQSYASHPSGDVLELLRSSKDGLNQDKADVRLKIKELNIPSFKKPPRWWLLALSVLPSPFNILLVLIAIISVAVPPPQWCTFGLIIFMIIISCVVQSCQEYRSSVVAIKLQNTITTMVRVRRKTAGFVENLIIEEKLLVPGDILHVDPGDVARQTALSSNLLIFSFPNQGRFVNSKVLFRSC
jgi:Mg2+-importing ATPase